MDVRFWREEIWRDLSRELRFVSVFATAALLVLVALSPVWCWSLKEGFAGIKPTATFSVTALPNAARIFQVSTSGSLKDVSWQYQLHRLYKNPADKTLQANSKHWHDLPEYGVISPLKAGDIYRVKVKAKNSNGVLVEPAKGLVVAPLGVDSPVDLNPLLETTQGIAADLEKVAKDADSVLSALNGIRVEIKDNCALECPEPGECCDPIKPPEPPPKPRDPIPPPEPDTTSKAKEIGRVCFVKNSLNYVKCSDHSGDAEQQLECVQKRLTHLNSSRAPVVEGHADPLGLPSHNLNLSQRRAEQVAEHLRKEGNRPFEIVAKGESHDTPFPDEQNTRKRMVRVLAYCDQHTAAGVPQLSQTTRLTECEVPNSNEIDPCET